MGYPWRLRLVHEGHSAIRVEREGRWFRFDPYEAPPADHQVVLTWAELERATGTVAAIKAGVKPRVVAIPALRSWLHSQGEVHDQSPGGKVDKVRVDAMEYQPIAYATPTEAARKVSAALQRPATAARRLLRRVQAPSTNPIVAQLTFADGSRLLHLNCSLHANTPTDWLDRAVQAFRGADWVIAGVDYEEQESFEALIPRFEPGKLLVTDLVNDTRAGLGLPVRHLTPLVDRLCEQGLAAFPFVGGAGYRFE